MSRNETAHLISETGIVPKKSKGQNFLIDGRVADRHIEFAEIEENDRVLEVGPGLGILTERLVEKTKNVTCIELDETLIEYIEEKFGNRIDLIKGDALKIEFPTFDRFVSNLPYSISTPIIFKLLDYDFKKAVVMVQKEFADRMVANVGSDDYSRLSVSLYYKAECKILEKVPASRFEPKPKVDSALVEIIPRKAPFKVKNEKLFFEILEITFNHRRKKIRTSLKAAGMIQDDVNIDHLDDRIETLTPEEIGKLSDDVYAYMESTS